MYIAVQRFNTVLERHTGTGLNPIINTYSSPAPSLVTNGLKVNLDAASLTPPAEGALTTAFPGNYFRNSPTWPDSSGNGNNGTFRTSGDSRFAEYFVADYTNAPEVRFRAVNAAYPKLYQSGYSPDSLTTTYAGSDTGTFTFGGWIKVNSNFPNAWLTRGNDSNGGGWSLKLGASHNGTVYLNVVPSGSGALTATRAASTTLQADVWYHAYMVWKPSGYVKIYLNGTLEAQWTNTYSGLRSSGTGFGINSNVFGNSSGHGKTIVGAYHVYDRELTEAEIRQNFNAHKSIYNVLSAEDADAQAFVVAAGLTSNTQISAVNTLVTSLKSANIWTKMKAIYPFVGGSAYSHKFNLKDPRNADAAYRLAFTGGMTHSSTGVLFGASSGYADTKLAPSAMGMASQHLSFYTRINNNTQMGVSVNGYNWVDTIDSTMRAPINLQSYAAVSAGISSSTGFVLGNRNSSTNVAMYKNGAKLTDFASSSNYQETYPIYINALNRNATINISPANEYAFASIGDGLTDAEAAALYSAVQAYQTTLGRQV